MIRNIFIIIILAILLSGCSKGGITYTVEEYNLEVDGGTIYGTLTLPKGVEDVPVAIIHAGSGPTDRNGNSNIAGDNNSLKMIAEALAEEGIASLRYDKLWRI